MSYASLLVNLNLGQSNRTTLAVAQRLAERLDAVVMGMAGGHPSEMVYADGYSGDDVYALERTTTARLLREAHEEFLSVFPDTGDGHGNGSGWRATGKFESVTEFAARQARRADLLITGVPIGAFPNAARAADTSDLILQAGRPVLVVPAGCEVSALDWVLVAWKDTREARRAVADALPMLVRARHVQLVEIASDKDHQAAQSRLDDVAAWLARHEVGAETTVVLANPDDPDQLGALATELGADLVVAGAYGHSRLREWALGGVTRSLLQGLQRCSLLSH